METKTITIRVTPDAARAYELAAPDDRRRLEALLSLKLSEIRRSKRSLEEIMEETSRKAQERGLTPGLLESMLDEQ
jgi:hypothetical protein